MSLLVESIHIHNGRIKNLSLHEKRANNARSALFGIDTPIDFKRQLKITKSIHTHVKCRVLYDQYIRDIQFLPYQQIKIHSLKIVHADDISYDFKYVNREHLTELYDKRGNYDEIIMVKYGLVTDSYYFNIVLEKNGFLYTPTNPLLKGVQREALLLRNRIMIKDIYVEDINFYDNIFLINALNPLGQIKLSTKNVNY